jgi:hypothetical protein
MTYDIHLPTNEPVKRGYIYYFGFRLIPAVVMPVFLITAVVSIIYSVRTRTLEDYLLYAGMLAVPHAIYFAYISLPLIRTPGSQKDKLLGIITLVNAPFTGFTTAAFYYSIAAAASDVFRWLVLPAHQSMAANVAIGLATLGVGAVLFFVRLRYRSIYGLTEVSAGMFIAAFRFSVMESVSALADPNVLIFLLTAGVYLVVRGLDNIHQGLTKDPHDRFAVALVDWYKELGTDEVLREQKVEEGKTVNRI